MQPTIDSREVSGRLEEIYNSKKPNISIEGFEVIWTDEQKSIGNRDIGEHGVPNKKIIYIPQSYLNRLVEEKEEEGGIHTIIENVLKQENGKVYSKLNSSERENTEKIAKNITSLFFYINDVKEQSEEIRNLGDKKGVQIEIKNLEDEITELKKTTGMSDDEIKKYDEFVQRIEALKRGIEQHKSDQKQLEVLKSINPFHTIDSSNLSQSMKQEIDDFYESLKTETSKKWQEFIDNKLSGLANQQQSTNKNLSEVEENFKPLLEKAEKSTLLKEKNNQIEIQQKKLNEIQRKEKIKEKIINLKNGTIKKLKQLHRKFHELYVESKVKNISRQYHSKWP